MTNILHTLKVVHLDESIPKLKLPRKGDVGIDLYAAETVDIRIGETALISLGVKVEIPECFAVVLKDRSSKSKFYHVLAGVIDSSYRGEWKLRVLGIKAEGKSDAYDSFGNKLFTDYNDYYRVHKGDKVAQAILIIDLAQEFGITEVDSINDTDRGEGGFGSTGN